MPPAIRIPHADPPSPELRPDPRHWSKGSFDRIEADEIAALTDVTITRTRNGRQTILWRQPLTDFLSDRRNAAKLLVNSLKNAASSPEAVQLSIPATSARGFDIHLVAKQGQVRAAFGQFETDFADIEHAMIWVERALSGDYVLRTISYGRKPVEWRLEPLEMGPGRPVLASGYVLGFRWLMKKSVRVQSYD